MKNILTALFTRGNWCWLLGHKSQVKDIRGTDNDLFNIPVYKRCKHCSHNMGVSR